MFLTSSWRNLSIRGLSIILLSIVLMAGIILSALHPINAAAQTSTENPWTTPVNISKSGSITVPDMVLDPAGVLHTIWLEESIGYNYSSFTNGEWSEPVMVEFPFAEYEPVLAAGDEFIYAFWIDKENEDTLMVSRVTPDKFGEVKSWIAPVKISKNVAAVSVNMQPGGRIHLGYIHALEETDRPEGVVYAQSTEKEAVWSDPILVYSTKYFRSIKPDELNIQLTAVTRGEQETISMVWDVPAIKSVFFANSVDGGATWDVPVEVDGPSRAPESTSPFKIRIAAKGNQAVRLWQGNLQSGIYCTQFYQYSKDGGRSWTERATMLTNVRGCATQNDLMVMADDNLLLLSIFPDEVYLSAFDGTKWSDPQLQSTLTSFENPATTEQVTFACQKPLLAEGKRLYIVGCDDDGPKDAWILWQEIEGEERWFPRPSTWGAPIKVVSGEEPIYAAQGITDVAGRVHVVWTQRVPAERVQRSEPGPEERSIYYAVWDGKKLSEPGLVLQSPDQYAGAFSLGYDKTRDRLALVWEVGKKGELFFSWADVARASSALEWAAPVSLPLVDPLARSPDVAVRADGTIFVAYTIPVNEYRGIYLVKSTDGGVTWTEPIAVYRGSGLTQMVDAPKLALSGDQDVHLLWAQNSLLAEPGPISLSYARSSDDGQSWPAPIVTVPDPVSSWWILNTETAGIQRFWKQKDQENESLHQDFSMDGGATWSLPGNLTGLGEVIRAIDIGENGSNGLSLVQIIQDGAGELTLRTQRWSGETWQEEDVLKLEETAQDPLHSLDSEVLDDGSQVVFYAVQLLDSPDDLKPWELILRVRNPKASTGATTKTPAASSATVVPKTPSPAAKTPASTEIAVLSTTAAVETATIETAVQTTTPQSEAQVTAGTAEATPVAPEPTQVVPQTAVPPIDDPAMTNNMGLILAGGISLAVVAIFVAISRYRRMR